MVEPRATYRVQLRSSFGFREAADLADYLEELGISHLYASPYLQAAPGSSHGYDVIDHSRVNEELGGAEGHARMCAALREHGIGQLIDVVPNHMAIVTPGNHWWWDVLENGPASRYAPYFDVEWHPPEAKLRNTILLPVLGDHYGRVLERGELRLVRQGGTFTVRYHEHAWPVAPTSIDGILASAAARSGSETLAFLADAHARLPLSSSTDPQSLRRRHRDKEVLRELLERLTSDDPGVAASVDAIVAAVNVDPDALDALLERQNYRLAFWRTASRDLGYRRFFDVNTLVGLRSEDDRVFDDTHRLALRWLADGLVDGLRVDHPDGLRDPAAYFARFTGLVPRPWLVAEKILLPGERLRMDWGVDGTTGYDFMNRVGGLFVEPAGASPMTRFYAEFTGESADYAMVVAEKKRQVVREVLGSDVNRLTALFLQICERHRRHRDYTRHELQEALRELIVRFPVYRSYVRAESGQVGAEDQQLVEETVAAAKAGRPDLEPELFDFFAEIMLLHVSGPAESELVMRFQQVTGPVMAKGVEDTAFYCYNRLIALNEVGGDPGRFGIEPAEIHAAFAEARESGPRSLLASSTHDSKRSEDVRARLHLLSEIPDRWSKAVVRWAARNERYRREARPDRNAEYLYYQTLVGAWPLEPERATAYMVKAVREAKAHTSWTSPNEGYETALRAFVEASLSDREFTDDVARFVEPLIAPGRVNSLAQLLVKLTAPGVPDLYQGSELWDLSLVDPDNRRPVDFEKRRLLLARLRRLAPAAVMDGMDEGLPKLWVVRQALAVRRSCPHLLAGSAAYAPLIAQGSRARHAFAFVRGGGTVTLVPRLLLGLGSSWEDTTVTLPGGTWRNVLTGDEGLSGRVALADLLRRFPVALLVEGRPA
jgi:(1->4)-alpha-D-glucan 1-alpha-D-glucosylmutase